MFIQVLLYLFITLFVWRKLRHHLKIPTGAKRGPDA